mgnify:CR=1 FL=1|jgi:hypothetical protein
MYECPKCESLIPLYYTNCPICGQKLSRNDTKIITFKRKLNTKSKDETNEISAEVEYSEVTLDDISQI